MTSAEAMHIRPDQQGLRRTPEGGAFVWLRSDGTVPPRSVSSEITAAAVEECRKRMERFQPALSALFPHDEWDGAVKSQLIKYPVPIDGCDIWIKGDHALPVTGSVKARGGVHEVLCCIEAVLGDALRDQTDLVAFLALPETREQLSKHTISVASTGNLGYSIGLLARSFGFNAEVHMSHNAKQWKKDRLRAIGARVVEHDNDYNSVVEAAKIISEQQGFIFVDDTYSVNLFLGYAVAADELIGQLDAAGITPTDNAPLVVYLPCGVGGAPGGITYGLRSRLGSSVVIVFVEPIQSACMLAALSFPERQAVSVFDFGLTNATIADGLAVGKASQLVLDTVGHEIDAIIALSDREMADWVGTAWRDAALRLEPSAAASLAAIPVFLKERPDLRVGTHIAWATGGSMLPDSEFRALIGPDMNPRGHTVVPWGVSNA